MKDNNKEEETIDLRKVAKKVWQRKKLFYKVLPIVFVVSCVYILFVPRYYDCSVMLAPEMENPVSGGALSSLASSFGVNLNSGMTTDAISPTLYPDLMSSTDFLISLFPVVVTTEDGELSEDYYTYMLKHQKSSVWSMPFKWMLKMMKKAAEWLGKEEKYAGEGKVNAFRLSEEQRNVADKIADKVKCSINKKTDVITITVRDQDPLICASLADTISVRLQGFITNYRTNKARIDMEYYENLTQEAKKDYDEALKAYGLYADANMNVVLESYKLRQTELENDMQLKFNTYSALNTQLQAAKAKVQEKTPAFTVLQCASVPIKPVGPKRVLFVLGMLFVACGGIVVYILKDDLIRQMKQ